MLNQPWAVATPDAGCSITGTASLSASITTTVTDSAGNSQQVSESQTYP